MPVEISEENAGHIVELLSKAYEKKDGILSERENLVENQIPENVESLSVEHALFLFYILSNDHGMKSSRLYKKAKELYGLDSSLFKPASIVRRFSAVSDSDLIKKTGIFLSVRYPKITAKNWFVNSQELLSVYNGDPISLFQSSRNANTLLKSIMKFKGYGPKTGGMLLRAIVGLGFTEVDDIESVLVPVDIHDARISFYTGILRLKDIDVVDIDYRKYIGVVQKTLRDTCKTKGVAWPDVDRALWIIGSKGCVKWRCNDCPLRNDCTMSRSDGLSNSNLEEFLT